MPGGAKPFLYSAGKARGELRAYSKLRRNLRAAREGLCGRHRQEAASPACIHGHFLPLSYRHLARRADVRFVTWLREPIDRLLSHYHYWRRAADSDARDTLQDPMQDKVQRRLERVHARDLSLYRFALELRERRLAKGG